MPIVIKHAPKFQLPGGIAAQIGNQQQQQINFNQGLASDSARRQWDQLQYSQQMQAEQMRQQEEDRRLRHQMEQAELERRMNADQSNNQYRQDLIDKGYYGIDQQNSRANMTEQGRNERFGVTEQGRNERFGIGQLGMADRQRAANEYRIRELEMKQANGTATREDIQEHQIRLNDLRYGQTTQLQNDRFNNQATNREDNQAFRGDQSQLKRNAVNDRFKQSMDFKNKAFEMRNQANSERDGIQSVLIDSEADLMEANAVQSEINGLYNSVPVNKRDQAFNDSIRQMYNRMSALQNSAAGKRRDAAQFRTPQPTQPINQAPSDPYNDQPGSYGDGAGPQQAAADPFMAFYNSLPIGTPYTAPDGSKRIKR